MYLYLIEGVRKPRLLRVHLSGGLCLCTRALRARQLVIARYEGWQDRDATQWQPRQRRSLAPLERLRGERGSLRPNPRLLA